MPVAQSHQSAVVRSLHGKPQLTGSHREVVVYGCDCGRCSAESSKSVQTKKLFLHQARAVTVDIIITGVNLYPACVHDRLVQLALCRIYRRSLPAAIRLRSGFCKTTGNALIAARPTGTSGEGAGPGYHRKAADLRFW